MTTQPALLDQPADGIEQGKRLIRIEGDRGQSLAERVANHFHRLTWRTPLHKLRLRGRFPLKLLAVPLDPVIGDAEAGRALLRGQLQWNGESVLVKELSYSASSLSPGFNEHIQSFAWLRDLSTAATRVQGAPVAEAIMRKWLAAHGEHVSDTAWRADLWGRRILFWTAHAPLILSSQDLVYRSAVLNALARGARHLDRGADRAPQGVARVAAWCGVIAAGLLIPGGEPRRVFGEAGLVRALGTAFHDDGGTVCRSPAALLEAIMLLSMLRACYDIRRQPPPGELLSTLARAVPALLGVTHGDGGLASWQGGIPVPAERVAPVIEASGVRTRPLRQSREWGYQRLSGGQSAAIVDAAPPPVLRVVDGGCASTLALEFSDGPHRIIVSCGGARFRGASMPTALAEPLRTTAAHSTLILSDSNSTSVHSDGSLGRGVVEVEVDRQEFEGGSRVEASHDGYARRFGLVHRRLLALSSDGRELRGEDMLLPAPGRRRRSRSAPFAIRFHLVPGIEATATADNQGALLRIEQGPLWQFRCKGAVLGVEESIWIDPRGRPVPTQQLVLIGESPAGGASIAWLFKRAK